MQLGYEPGEIIHKKNYSLPFGILGQNGKMVPYRKGILNGYLQDVGVLKGSIIPTQKITAGMGLAIFDVISSSLVQVRAESRDTNVLEHVFRQRRRK